MSKKKNKKQKQNNDVEVKVERIVKEEKETTFPTVLLSIISLVCGCLVMVIELTSSRVLAPYYGNTIYCWTGVIGTILFAMSLGYLLGGFFAEKYAEKKLLYTLLIASGVTASLIPFLISQLAGFLASYDSYTTGPIIGTLLIFCVPAFCFSTIPPLCVKIICKNVKMVGVASGIVSSTSAMGSIIGTFLTGFYLIPHFTLSQIYFFTAVIPFILFLVSYSLQKYTLAQKMTKSLVIILATFLMWQFHTSVDVFPNVSNKKEVYKNLNAYHLVRVYENDRHFTLRLDSTQEGALSKKKGELVFNYTKYWELIKCFKKTNELKNVCFIGGGAFAMPTIFHRNFPECNVDAVEIDPELKKIGKKYFQLEENENLNVHIADGRRWFRGKKNTYDFIFLDAFHGVRSIPHHLVTSEYFAELHSALTDKGVIAINLIAAREGSQATIYKSLLKTIKTSFPKIVVFSVNPVLKNIRTNLILFVFKQEKLNLVKARREAEKLGIKRMYQNKVEIIDDAYVSKLSDYPILTDEYAPVEYMVAKDH